MTETEERIPERVIQAYIARYPHLEHLARRKRQMAFACNALRLATPPGVTLSDVWAMSKVAVPERSGS